MIEIGNVMVYCVFVNIFEYTQTASTRGKSTILELVRFDLLNAVKAASLGGDVPDDE
jgi:hypothetical protein